MLSSNARDRAASPHMMRTWAAAVRLLPRPVYALEFAVRSGHYHLGLFDNPQEDLGTAQDRVVDRVSTALRPGDRVLDIGCGMGGASRLLASRGCDVHGIDPCAGAIRFAEAMHTAGRRRAVHEAVGFESFASRCGRRFDGAIAIEVLQHFRSLDQFLAVCAAVLRAGGVLQVCDLSLDVDVAWERAPYHHRGSLTQRARAAGFAVLEHVDLTASMQPTFGAFRRALVPARLPLSAFFADRGAGRGATEADVDEILQQVSHLERAVIDGHLRYESTTLRRP